MTAAAGNRSLNSEGGLVQDGLLRGATHTPNRTAVVCGDQQMSYQKVASRARAVAHQIRALDHIGEGAGVALCLPNSIAVIETFFGTLMAGGCICLYDPAWPQSLLLELLDDHKPDVLIAPDSVVADVIDELVETRVIPLSMLGPSYDENEITLKTVQPDSPFLIGFTSGSSGKPKAFIRSHQTWVNSFSHSANELGTTPDDYVIAPGPLSHGLSLYAVIEALNMGATAIIQPQFDAGAVLGCVEQARRSSLTVVPAMLDGLLDEAQTRTFPGLRSIITAGAKLSPALRDRCHVTFPGAAIIEYYGASELSFVSVAKGSERIPAESVGRAFAGVDISVRDETGQEIPVGEIGTVWIKSDMICTGYVGFTDGSGLRKSDGWASVGDLGHLDKEGFLYLAGREGSAITSAGYTVYPSAIENALLRHPAVSDAAVIGLPHERWGEVIAAVVVPKSGRSVSQDQLVSYCETVLEPYACPRTWRIVSVLERTQSGKVKRSDLSDLFS